VDQSLISALSALGGALVGGAISLLLQREQFRQEGEMHRQENKTVYAAEDTVRRMLSHTKYECRRFSALRKALLGFDDNELRRLLIRAGACSVDRGDGEEWWVLSEREPEYFSSVRAKEGRP